MLQNYEAGFILKEELNEMKSKYQTEKENSSANHD